MLYRTYRNVQYVEKVAWSHSLLLSVQEEEIVQAGREQKLSSTFWEHTDINKSGSFFCTRSHTHKQVANTKRFPVGCCLRQI